MTHKLIALVLVVSSVALAQTEPPKQVPRPQEVTFEAGEILGSGYLPTDSYVPVKPKVGGFKSLIKVRADFNDKLRNSVYEM